MDHPLFFTISLPFFGTAIGAALVFFLRGNLHLRLEQSLSGFAAGVMTAASVWSLLIPALERSVAYGMNPAILEYNGISTLDGYLGFHSMEYHNQFRKIIEPAFPGNEWARQYYDEWGARAFIFSGSGESSYN